MPAAGLPFSTSRTKNSAEWIPIQARPSPWRPAPGGGTTTTVMGVTSWMSTKRLAERPGRRKVTRNDWPWLRRRAFSSSAHSSTTVPLTDVTRSPLRRPALAAGDAWSEMPISGGLK